MEFGKIIESKIAKVFLVGGLGAFALAGCGTGQHDAPTKTEVREGVEYIEIERPDGTDMECVMFSDEGSAGYAGYSWFSLDCDWSDGYQGKLTQPEVDTSNMVCEQKDDETFICRES